MLDSWIQGRSADEDICVLCGKREQRSVTDPFIVDDNICQPCYRLKRVLPSAVLKELGTKQSVSRPDLLVIMDQFGDSAMLDDVMRRAPTDRALLKKILALVHAQRQAQPVANHGQAFAAAVQPSGSAARARSRSVSRAASPAGKRTARQAESGGAGRASSVASGACGAAQASRAAAGVVPGALADSLEGVLQLEVK
jgi:hypothetical protein